MKSSKFLEELKINPKICDKSKRLHKRMEARKYDSFGKKRDMDAVVRWS